MRAPMSCARMWCKFSRCSSARRGSAGFLCMVLPGTCWHGQSRFAGIVSHAALPIHLLYDKFADANQSKRMGARMARDIACILADWGTTNLRAWAMAQDGRVL